MLLLQAGCLGEVLDTAGLKIAPGESSSVSVSGASATTQIKNIVDYALTTAGLVSGITYKASMPSGTYVAQRLGIHTSSQ